MSSSTRVMALKHAYKDTWRNDDTDNALIGLAGGVACSIASLAAT